MENNEITKILRILVGQGWRVKGGGNRHYRCAPPDRTKPIVFLPSTPSESRGLKNAKAQLRKSGANL